MANAPQNEKKIYQEIERKKLRVHPLIWGLLSHHVRNDLQVIVLAAEELRYCLRENEQSPNGNLVGICESILARGRAIDGLLSKLRTATSEEKERSMVELFERI